MWEEVNKNKWSKANNSLTFVLCIQFLSWIFYQYDFCCMYLYADDQNMKHLAIYFLKLFRYFDTQNEVKMACPVCQGTCTCKDCWANQCKDTESKVWHQRLILFCYNTFSLASLADTSVLCHIVSEIFGWYKQSW